MSILSLNQKNKRVELGAFELENSVVFNYFNKLPSNERDEKLFRAIYIGVLALMEDRISAFLSKTSNELGTELESLKMIFEMKKELFFKSAIKGNLAEDEIAEFLNEFFIQQGLKDTASLTGNTAGNIPRNKTGDIICAIDGDDKVKIAIECKFDKSLKLGDISSKDIFVRKTDTAWNQLLEAQVNREAKIGLIVFDVSLVDNSILQKIQNVGFIPSLGFVAIVDSQRGDYKNLTIAYMLARDTALNARTLDFDKDVFAVLISRLIKDIGETLSIKNLVLNSVEINKQILSQLDKSLLLIEFNQKYLTRFLKDGALSKKDLLDFYSGEEIKDKFKSVEQEIIAL